MDAVSYTHLRAHETPEATFTFKGTPKSALPDTPGDLAEATN